MHGVFNGEENIHTTTIFMGFRLGLGEASNVHYIARHISRISD